MNRSRPIAEKLRHWLLVLLSPLILGVIASLVVAWGSEQPILGWMWWLALVMGLTWVVLYLAAYTKAFRVPLEAIAGWRRSSRFRHPRVLVLDGRLDEQTPAVVPSYYTDRRPDDWRHALSSLDSAWTIELGPASQLEESTVDVVVNPFGEAYAEADLALHTNLKRLTDWVHQGGVYVNVAGYPFWWQHNPATGVTTESGRWELKTNQAAQLVSATLKPILSDALLGISPEMGITPQVLDTQQSDLERQRFGEIAGAGGSSKAKVFRPYAAATASMIPLLRTTDSRYIVIGAVQHGLGAFVFAGVEIDRSSTAFDKVVAAVKGWCQYEAGRRKP